MKSRFLIIIFSATIISSLIGCAAPPAHQMLTSFNAEELAPYLQKGTAKLTGQAFLKTNGGDIKYGAGNEIILIPNTTYSKELLGTGGGAVSPPPDPRWRGSFVKTISDGSGNFEFVDLPAGDYHLETNITWKVPGRYGMTTTGDTVKKAFNLKSGEKLKIILTE